MRTARRLSQRAIATVNGDAVEGGFKSRSCHNEPVAPPVSERLLPNCVIVGAPKAGTTSLAAYLSAHPAVFMSPAKELRFFDDDSRWARGGDWYAMQFRGSHRHVVRGEATPTYLSSSLAAARMAELVPGAKLIALLREPGARAYSEYNFALGYGAEVPSFESIVGGCEDLPTEGDSPFLWRSRYLPQLQAYSQFLGHGQMLILLFEELRHDPEGTFERVCSFLEVEPLAPGNLGTVYNSSRRFRSPALRLFMEGVWTSLPRGLMERLDRLNSVPVEYPPLSDTLAHRLNELFASENAALARWLDLDLSSWDMAVSQ